jgi:hypothetical protein
MLRLCGFSLLVDSTNLLRALTPVKIYSAVYKTSALGSKQEKVFRSYVDANYPNYGGNYCKDCTWSHDSTWERAFAERNDNAAKLKEAGFKTITTNFEYGMLQVQKVLTTYSSLV